MRKQGTVVRWEGGKGFGFIRAAGMQDVFFHVKDFRSPPATQPHVGMEVGFEHVHVGGKGPRATAIWPAASAAATTRQSPVRPRSRAKTRRTSGAPASGAWAALPLMLAYALVLAWAVWRKQLPWWVIPASGGLNLAAFFAYWQDKYAAEQRRWRIPEKTLHLWSLAGGWAGAWFAQQVLRHKSSKASFRGTYWLTVLVHCGAVGYWAYTRLNGGSGFPN